MHRRPLPNRNRRNWRSSAEKPTVIAHFPFRILWKFMFFLTDTKRNPSLKGSPMKSKCAGSNPDAPRLFSVQQLAAQFDSPKMAAKDPIEMTIVEKRAIFESNKTKSSAHLVSTKPSSGRNHPHFNRNSNSTAKISQSGLKLFYISQWIFVEFANFFSFTSAADAGRIRRMPFDTAIRPASVESFDSGSRRMCCEEPTVENRKTGRAGSGETSGSSALRRRSSCEAHPGVADQTRPALSLSIGH